MTKHYVGENIEDFILTKYLGNSKWELSCQKCNNVRIMATGDINRYIKLKRKFYCQCDITKKEYENLSGQIFGKLTVTNSHPIKKGKYNALYWECICSCENKTILYVRGNHLKSGNIKSCGCILTEREPNFYDLGQDYGIGYTSKGVFYFDKEDYNEIYKYRWYTDTKGYIASRTLEKKKDNKIFMHRLLLNPESSEQIDHINRCKYDNRKSNLRICSDSLNKMNKNISKNNISGKTGVTKVKDKWAARISFQGKNYNLGIFDNLDDAINARINKEKELLGDWIYYG